MFLKIEICFEIKKTCQSLTKNFKVDKAVRKAGVHIYYTCGGQSKVKSTDLNNLKFNSETYKIALFSNTLTISLQFKDDSWA